MQKDCVMSTTDSTFAYLTSLFFLIYMPIKDNLKNQRQSFLQQQKPANYDLFYQLTVLISNNALVEITHSLLKSPKTHAIQSEYRVLNALNLEK